MGDRYERVYDVGLLDDLHNYFPGLLYEQERFRSVPDILAYIRQNTSRRFNLYEYGSRQYLQQNRTPQNTFTRQTPVVNRWAQPPPSVAPLYEFDLTNESDLSALFPLLRSLDRLAGLSPYPVPQQPIVSPIQRATAQAATAATAATAAQRVNRFAGIFEDIVVHSSQELIDSASNMRTLLMDLEGSCSICQDRMRQGENVRRLNVCQHEFHGACIDNWFLHQSVLCPVCRHDIRDLNPSIRSPVLEPSVGDEVPPVSSTGAQEPESNPRLRPRI